MLSFGLGIVTDVDVTAPHAEADNVFMMSVSAPAFATWLLCIAL
jgi:hypothetical protein